MPLAPPVFSRFFLYSPKNLSWMAWTASLASDSSSRTETLISLVEII